jgi:hypothetical protein
MCQVTLNDPVERSVDGQWMTELLVPWMVLGALGGLDGSCGRGTMILMLGGLLPVRRGHFGRGRAFRTRTGHFVEEGKGETHHPFGQEKS